MKKRILLVLAVAALLLLVVMLNRANPIIEGFFNELVFDSAGWKLEMHTHVMTLDGWRLTSRSGQAYFKNGIQLGGIYRVITPESLLSPLTINPLGDSLILHSPQFPMAQFKFGPGAVIAAPLNGQSICLRESGNQFHYLDNTPTLGQQNDGLNATGSVTGRVRDSLGSAIPGVRISWGEESVYAYSDTGGRFSFTSLATRASIHFEHSSHSTRTITVQVWPESTVTLDVAMSRIVGIDEKENTNPDGFKLWLNYPNPFNPTTRISYELPGRVYTTLKVFDTQGRNVSTLVDGVKEAGLHTASWNAEGLPSGVYFCRLQGASHMATIKMLLLR